MYGFYTPVLILQAICLFHAYKNRSEQRWYWVIIFFPAVGCAIYLYYNFYNRKNIQTLAEGVKGAINSNYKLEQLEKAVRFSNNFSNKMNLADAYISYGRYEEAIVQYSECLTGFMAEDPTLNMKLLNAFFLHGDYASAIAVGKRLQAEKSFKNSEQRIVYAWALHFNEKTDQAFETFEDMDKSFTNYKHRIEYCKFLNATKKSEELKIKLTDLVEEIEHMKAPERRSLRDFIREIKDMYAKHVRS